MAAPARSPVHADARRAPASKPPPPPTTTAPRHDCAQSMARASSPPAGPRRGGVRGQASPLSAASVPAAPAAARPSAPAGSGHNHAAGPRRSHAGGALARCVQRPRARQRRAQQRHDRSGRQTLNGNAASAAKVTDTCRRAPAAAGARRAPPPGCRARLTPHVRCSGATAPHDSSPAIHRRQQQPRRQRQRDQRQKHRIAEVQQQRRRRERPPRARPALAVARAAPVTWRHSARSHSSITTAPAAAVIASSSTSRQPTRFQASTARGDSNARPCVATSAAQPACHSQPRGYGDSLAERGALDRGCGRSPAAPARSARRPALPARRTAIAAA